MLLKAKDLLAAQDAALLAKRRQLTKTPGLALVWVGDDPQTAAFTRVKQRKAQDLECQFFLHHFEVGTTRQLEALVKGLNARKDVDGIVLQLPLPKNIDSAKLIAALDRAKDIDNLRGDSNYSSPTPTGIVDLLKANEIDLANGQTMILGAGPLVGGPLAEIFRASGWPFEQIASNAESQAKKIRQCDVLISCTGVPSLVTPEMVGKNMVVVDGSGVDVDVASIEPLVKLVTPKKGAVGPLTVINLFSNLLLASGRRDGSAGKNQRA